MSELRVSTPGEIRNELEQLVRSDLLGPAGGPEEILPQYTSPRDRYLVGLLAPSGQEVAPDLLEELFVSSEDEELPDQPSAGRSLFPSSLGLSFCIPAGYDGPIVVDVSWGQYRHDVDKILENAKPHKLWRRIPYEASLSIPKLSVGSFGPISFPAVQQPGAASKLAKQPNWSSPEKSPGLQGVVRQTGALWIVSLFLVNGQSIPKNLEQQAWMFQVQMTVRAPFVPRPQRQDRGAMCEEFWQETLDDDRLYHKIPEYAVGHGTAVSYSLEKGLIRTEALPRSCVQAQSPPTLTEAPALADLNLGMEAMSEIGDGQFGVRLNPILKAYSEWITSQKLQVAELEPRLQSSADRALVKAGECLERIASGITLLDQNKMAADAFRFANRAMAKQRMQSLIATKNRKKLSQEIDEVPTWRVFQMAFILLNLRGLAEPDHQDRAELADLLFFPTGGGKTEAYLGLTAYTLALRRLQPDPDHQSGVAVIMRYTLRLLTVQQFQRAAVLVCACEWLRRAEPKRWGSEPFRLGLWVGSKTTPNKTSDAEEAVRLLKASKGTQRFGNPLQLTNCPWCGSELTAEHIKVRSFEQGDARTILYCGDALGKCPFSERQASEEGLPIVVVDEEIYRRLPAVLIATIDKFAQMAWNGAVGTLFGRIQGYCPRHGYTSPSVKDETFHHAKAKFKSVKEEKRGQLRPPDLIIQDELHLISGPLGTLAGLFEIAIEELCCWSLNGKRIRPKVIASTATIRRSGQQVRRIFDREVAVFPPPGLTVSDNFFSRTRPDQPGRLYLGICAPGVRTKTALIRCYLSLLSSAETLKERYGEHSDPWMTLVGYFNSLRELGGMRRLTEDQVIGRLSKMNRWNLSSRRLYPEKIQELTSRVSASDIPKILDRLENKVVNGKDGIELLLATNMLSVGVDIPRLGLLVVAGQPKSAAEYIQATSRVGRSASGPGMVVTVYNWARPRDLSHFEKFDHFHQTFYQQVEALSVTPYSSRAIDRGLTSVLVALIRLWSLAYNLNDKAYSLSLRDPIVTEVMEALSRRSGGQIPQSAVQERLDAWVKEIEIHRTNKTRLGYKDQSDGLTVGLLKRPADADWETWTVLESMREVEPPTNLVFQENWDG